MKKGLKIWLIVWGSLLVIWWVWAWLTKTWVIPNWFGIKFLCHGKSCVNCQWKAFYAWEIYQIGWKICCEWTYKIKEIIYITWSDSNIWIDFWNDCLTKDWKWCFYYEKPIIYLYPTQETKVQVKLWIPENLLHTYPKYNSERWRNVIAQPNWDLKDIDTWRKLYALYREWKNEISTNFDEWFIVKWEDIIPFLEEKLAILWLNEREAEEFIVYWLPQMENNKYNLIRFETVEEQNENMSLNITPKPDTVIRVMMDWKAIDESINVSEQKLITPERNWFTVVEWWGSPRN